MSAPAGGAGAIFRDGVLMSERFHDVYATRAGALAQARAVFLRGCGLPEAWAGRRHFTVAELGFGTGLNMLALLDLWTRTRPMGGHLHMFSVEAHPLPKALAAQALALSPEVAELAALLLAQWPAQRAGKVRIDFPELDATLDLALAEAQTAVADWAGVADAWFLDGFAPALNPAMWAPELLQLVAVRTAPGGRIATWSVAGPVRRALVAGGLEVSRQPGFADKRQRLEARKAGHPAADSALRIAIVGAGIAGAALARAVRAMGGAAEVFAEGPMASGNPAALIMPRLATGSAVATALHAQAFARATRCIRREAPGAIIATGADWLLKRDEPARAQATLAAGLYPDGSLTLDGDCLRVRDALVVSPARLRQRWLGEVTPLHITALERTADGWWLGSHGPFDAVLLAAGIGTAALAGLPLRAVRGQVTTAALPAEMRPAPQSWGGYVVPTDAGVLFGATHQRDDTDRAVRSADDATNLRLLGKQRPDLADALHGAALQGFAGVRAATGYNQPVATCLAPGLFALTGLAGRGFTLAPLLAEHVVALALGVASPVGRQAARLLDCMHMQPLVPRTRGLEISRVRE